LLFKEKLLLSNCDSVRILKKEELRKRFLTGLVFADGVVLTPNTLIDNNNINDLITRANVVKYLNEEGYGKLIIRGFGLTENLNLEEYYKSLPSDFIISSLPGSPKKSQISPQQSSELLYRIETTQNSLNKIGCEVQGMEVASERLRDEIYNRINDNDVIGVFFNSDHERVLFKQAEVDKVSRSQWYQVADNYFGNNAERFKVEVINPAYNSLFALDGEGFLQDDIKFINDVPEIILDAGVVFKSLRNEIQLIEYPIRAFEIISSLGSGEIIKFLTDESIGYIEDKLEKTGKSYLTRKNWFGMYAKMKKYIGLEIK